MVEAHSASSTLRVDTMAVLKQAVEAPDKASGRSNISINSLTAIGACERQLFNNLHGTVVSCQIFIHSQSLIACWTRNDLILAAVVHDLYEACNIHDISKRYKLYLIWAS